MTPHARRVAVLGGVRIPFARQDGPYARASNQDMLTATLDALVTRFELDGQVLGEVADAPIALNDDLRGVPLEAKRAGSNAGRLRALAKVRPQQVVPEVPRNAEPRTGLSMGEHAAIMAREWAVSRADQDELAARSHRNFAAAYDTGFPRRPRHAVPGARARPERT
jgi:acetyl-CoA acetyltransferase